MRFVAMLAALSALATVGCGDDAGGAAKRGDGGIDAGGVPGAGSGAPNGGKDGGLHGSGSGSEPPFPSGGAPTACGGDPCAEVAPQLAALGAARCCTAKDRCGIETPLAPDVCLAPDARGGADPSCPSFAPEGLNAWAGCCTSAGECGALDTEGGLGCVANGNLMVPESPCHYDPANACTRIVEIACDGSEDCARGRMCCGRFDGAGYLEFACAESCAKLEASTDETWSQACHPGDACETDAFECLANPGYLPDTFYRCRDAGATPQRTGSTARGEINCGSDVCVAGQKCCVSFPGVAAQCAPAELPCPCDLSPPPDTDAGADDAG